MKTYIGVNNLSKEAKKIYIGYNNKAVELPITYVAPQKMTLTAKFDLSNSDPSTWGTYEDDAVGMVAGSAEFDDFFGHYPCILDNGVELGKLNPNNMAQYEDGTSAPITTLGKDVMICFPRRGIKIWSDSSYMYVSMTDEDNADGYSYMAHSYKGNPISAFYHSKYRGYVANNLLYSTSGQEPPTSITIEDYRTYAHAKGTGYELAAFYQLTYTQVMYMLKYLGQNAQIAIGRGYVDGNSAMHTTGGTNALGMDYGETTGTVQCSLFGIEDFWGNGLFFIDGIYADANRQLLAADGNYNNSGTNYTAITDKTNTSNYSGYLKTALMTNIGGFAPDVTTRSNYGTDSTYYCDQAAVSASCIARFAGSYSTSSTAAQQGVFDLRVNANPPTTKSSCCLMYMKP